MQALEFQEIVQMATKNLKDIVIQLCLQPILGW